MPPAARGQLLKDLARLILENRERLARIVVAEQGKPIQEARGEIEGAALYLTYAAEEARRITGDIIPVGHARRADLDPARRPWRGDRPDRLELSGGADVPQDGAGAARRKHHRHQVA